MKCKIAVVQFHTKQYSPTENLKKAEKFISEASDAKAHIIVFPEDFITGPLLGRTEFADSENRYKKYFQEMAKKYSIDIVPGSYAERSEFGVYNITHYIDSNGKVKSNYRKVNLWHPEKVEMNPGHKISVFDTEFGKIGLAICSDLMYPEFIRKLVTHGAEIIICPSCWTYEDARIGQKYDKNSEAILIDAMCVCRAFENEAIIVYCGAGGQLEIPDYENENLVGHSQIAVPFIGALKRLDHNNEEMFIQEVDTAILKDAQDVYKIREDLRTRILS